MKAKDHVAKIMTSENRKDAFLNTAEELMNQTIANMRSASSDGSRIAAFREKFQFWKAICEGVSKGMGDQAKSDFIALFPEMFFAISPDLYLICLNSNAMLGYVPSAEIGKKMNAIVEERKQMERDRLISGAFLFQMMHKQINA